jgi:hypothetical protein
VSLCAPCGKDVDLDLAPELRPRILRIKLSQLPQQFFSLLVPRHRHGDLDLDNLIPARAFLGGRRNTLLAQPQLLPRLRSRSNLQHASPIDGRHFDLRTKSRLDRRHRHRNIDVIALAPKQRMLANPDNHVKVSCAAAPQSGVALAGDANALPIACSRLDPDLQRIGALDAAFAMANRASRNILPRPMASRTGHIKLHPPASLFDRPLAMTLRTHPWSLNKAIAMTISADIAPGNIQLHHAAADRRPERHIDLILKIAARLRTFAGRLTAPATSENVGKDIAEPAPGAAGALPPPRPRAIKQIGKIEAAKIDVTRCARLAATSLKTSAKTPIPRLSAAASVRVRRSGIDIVRVKTKLVVDLPLLRIAEDVISLGKRLELFFRMSSVEADFFTPRTP